MKIKHNILCLLVVVGYTASGQSRSYDTNDSLAVRSIFDEALLNGKSYSQLNYLCKVIGHRLTGSQQAEDALAWAQKEVSAYNPDRIRQQSVEATRWLRGDKEWVAISEDVDLLLNACALGGSIGTDGPLQAEVIEVNGMKDLEKYNVGDFRGKIVFYNEPMNKALINTFDAYGACASQRYYGAVEAAKYGAVAVLVRSLTTLTDIKAHTGSMSYKDGIAKIPAAAIAILLIIVVSGGRIAGFIMPPAFICCAIGLRAAIPLRIKEIPITAAIINHINTHQPLIN